MKKETEKTLLRAQQFEITEHLIYDSLARSVRGTENAAILKKIAGEELAHYHRLAEITKTERAPMRWKAGLYLMIARIFGITFGLRLMEKGEDAAQTTYLAALQEYPQLKGMAEDEERHEQELLDMIDEERLRYMGSVVLGLNDALVELTGALAGLTFAFRQTEVVAAAGFITGVAASLSMAASEYLSQRSEDRETQKPLKAAVYTGVAYIGTVLFLVLPYLIFTNLYLCLGLALLNAAVIVFVFTFYMSVAKRQPFWPRFLEMLLLSLSVAGVSFGIGFVVRKLLGVEA